MSWSQPYLKEGIIKVLKLSDCELSIIGLIAVGLTTKEIGQTLYFSEGTIETYRRVIYKKCNVKNSANLIHWAHQNKILQ